MKDLRLLKTININSTFYTTRLSSKFENRKPFALSDPGLVLSFIPGTITEILVEVGQRVKKGEVILVLDAMKMQNKLKSSSEGIIRKINVNKGDRVSKGIVLVEIG